MRTIGLALAAGISLAAFGSAGAHTAAGRQYYSSWTYHPQKSYHYSYYYYKPYASYEGYKQHYCVYYPAQPRYVYYYNPYSQQYWGRLDCEAKGDEKYSLLAEKDRKKELKDIPETAFPKPAAMPVIPEAEDKTAMEPITDLPKATDK